MTTNQQASWVTEVLWDPEPWCGGVPSHWAWLSRGCWLSGHLSIECTCLFSHCSFNAYFLFHYFYVRVLSEFSDFIATLVIISGKILIVGDFDIHMDNENNSLTIAFPSLIDFILFSQHVNAPTHCHNHSIDLLLTYGLKIYHHIVLPQNTALSDHLIIFNMQLELCTSELTHFYRIHVNTTSRACISPYSLISVVSPRACQARSGIEPESLDLWTSQVS